MELPRWVSKKVRDNLWDPKEAKNHDRIKILRHIAWTENYQSEADDENVNDQVRLPHVLLLYHSSFICDRIEGNENAEKCHDRKYLTCYVNEEHRTTYYDVK